MTQRTRMTAEWLRMIKWQTYAELGLRQYWMADPRSRAVVECVLGPERQYRERVVSAPGEFRSELFPELGTDLTRVFG